MMTFKELTRNKKTAETKEGGANKKDKPILSKAKRRLCVIAGGIVAVVALIFVLTSFTPQEESVNLFL